MDKKVAVVTGSNKGIGFGIVKALLQRYEGYVYLTSRDEARGTEAVDELKALGLKPHYHQLNVSNRESVVKFRDYIEKTHGGIDILINNAGVSAGVETNITYEDIERIIDINYFSILTIKELLFPLLRDNGRVLNVSSDWGHLSNIKNQYWVERLCREDLKVEDVNEFVNWYLKARRNDTFNREDIAEDTFASYRVSKVALSAVTPIFQKELENRNISVNSVHPGIVRTNMTKGIGFYSIDEAAKLPVYLVLEAPDSLKGAYVWHDGKVVDWYDYKGDYYVNTIKLDKQGQCSEM